MNEQETPELIDALAEYRALILEMYDCPYKVTTYWHGKPELTLVLPVETVKRFFHVGAALKAAAQADGGGA